MLWNTTPKGSLLRNKQYQDDLIWIDLIWFRHFSPSVLLSEDLKSIGHLCQRFACSSQIMICRTQLNYKLLDIKVQN